MSEYKRGQFIPEPIQHKDVDAIAGVGQAAKQKLHDNGYDCAVKVVGQNMVCNDSELFKEFMKENAGSNKRNAALANDCVKDWRNQHI